MTFINPKYHQTLSRINEILNQSPNVNRHEETIYINQAIAN